MPLKDHHPAFGLEFHDIHRYIYKKYFKLQPYLSAEIGDLSKKHEK